MNTSSMISGSSITSSSDTSTTVHEQEEEEGVMTSSPSPFHSSSSCKNENRSESLQQTIPLQTNNNDNVKERTQSPYDKTTNHNGDDNEDSAVSSEPCCNTIKRRSWSMLELNEMKVIHGLLDDMEEILSLDKDDDDDDDDDDNDKEEEEAQEIQNVDFIFIDCDGNEHEKTDKGCDDKDVPMNNTLMCDESPVKECTERENGKRRNKGRNIQRGILKNLSVRRSMSMGSILYKHSSSNKSLKDSKLQRSVGDEADDDNDDEDDNHQDDDLMGYYSQSSACPSDRMSSLDHSHHDYSNHHGMNLGKILQDGYCSNPSPLSIMEYNGQGTNDWKDAKLPRLTKENGQVNKNEPEEEEFDADADAGTNAGTDAVSVCAKRALCRNRMNRISPSNYKFRTGSQSSTLSPPTNGTKEPLPTIVPVFRHCRERMPQSSILKKSTSMVHLNTSCNKHSTDITEQSYADCGKMRRVTSFSTLEIREYHVTIGDNPGGKQGPPLSLDWDYCEDRTVKIDIDRYEKMRPPRRKKHEMYMPGSIRMWTLMKYMGYSLREIEDASKAADSIRKKRAKSIKYQNIYDLQYRVGKLLKLGGRR